MRQYLLQVVNLIIHVDLVVLRVVAELEQVPLRSLGRCDHSLLLELKLHLLELRLDLYITRFCGHFLPVLEAHLPIVILLVLLFLIYWLH